MYTFTGLNTCESIVPYAKDIRKFSRHHAKENQGLGRTQVLFKQKTEKHSVMFGSGVTLPAKIEDTQILGDKSYGNKGNVYIIHKKKKNHLKAERISDSIFQVKMIPFKQIGELQKQTVSSRTSLISDLYRI